MNRGNFLEIKNKFLARRFKVRLYLQCNKCLSVSWTSENKSMLFCVSTKKAKVSILGGCVELVVSLRMMHGNSWLL